MMLPSSEVMPTARVLVVDDEPMVREVLERYLAREGFDVDRPPTDRRRSAWRRRRRRTSCCWT